MTLTIPELCLVILIGPSGSGKSTFARTHFKQTEILSSDFCRGLVCNDENSQDATGDAFDVLRYIAGKRLSRGLLTVIDATNVQAEARKPLVALANEHDVLPVAVVLRVDETICQQRNKQRPDRDFGPHVVRNQCRQLRQSLRGLEREGFRYVHVLSAADEIEQAQFERQPLWNNRKWDRGPFDIIGDVHGCYDELVQLLHALGYTVSNGEAGTIAITPPAGRKAVFLGDLVDRGPKSPQVLRLVMAMVEAGSALCLPGNHDAKLLRKLRGKNVQITHGLAETLAQLQSEPPEFLIKVEQFIDHLVGHYVLDDGRLVVAHAGLKEQYIGRASRRVREFALYGDTTGETDEFGLPVRHNWAADYRGDAHVIYGHTPIPEADWLNRTINIDTGCVFGGKLSAMRWPEREVISVPALRQYAVPARPFRIGDEIPSFGARVEGMDCTDRPGSYAVVRDDAGRVAVCHVTTDGAHYLPGGGADSGETPEQTCARECREECGRDILISRQVGQAVQYVVNRRNELVAKQCTYFDATFVPGTDSEPVEKDHVLLWLEPDEALKILALESDVWALQRVLNPQSAATSSLTAQQQNDDVLDIDDVIGKRIVSTRLHHSVTVREENAIAALEVMSRFAADPKWLIYLPPTMSPTETTRTEPELLEHPREVFNYFQSNGVDRVICEEKHMGSRAIVIVCRDEQAATRRFGVGSGETGIIYTRTGRRFFEDRALEAELLSRVRASLDTAGFWETFQSDWFCLDCELMPWSAKAQELLRLQYAAVGSSARAGLSASVSALAETCNRFVPNTDAALETLLDRHRTRNQLASQYVDAYRRYCWPVQGVDGIKLAPFHLLASEGTVHVDKDHAWHMETLGKIASPAGHLIATPYRLVDVTQPAQVEDAIQWWTKSTAEGGEGMVVKPVDFIVRGKRGLVQPAIKCRGKEYLRIIYGPEYTQPEHLERLRKRGLAAKRSLALREFALGIEGLERFIRREPLRRVHECVFGVLALESEPVDPRL